VARERASVLANGGVIPNMRGLDCAPGRAPRPVNAGAQKGQVMTTEPTITGRDRQEAILELLYPASNIDYGFRPDEIIKALTVWHGDRDKAVNEVIEAIALNNARRRQTETRKNIEAA